MDSSSTSSEWRIFGAKLPRSLTVFLSQTIIAYVVITVALINLSIGNHQETLWTALLSSCLGYLLPSPKIKKVKQQQMGV